MAKDARREEEGSTACKERLEGFSGREKWGM